MPRLELGATISIRRISWLPHKVLDKSFKRNMIKTAWRAAGLRPFNPELVISRLPEKLVTHRGVSTSSSIPTTHRTAQPMINRGPNRVLSRGIAYPEVSYPEVRLYSTSKCTYIYGF